MFEFRHRIAGTFNNNKPMFMLRDPEVIKSVTVKEFDHFVNHGDFFDPDNAGLFGLSLFAMRDQKWKDMRSTLSPAFTGSKMRLMFELIRDVSSQTMNYLKQHENYKNGIELDIILLLTRFANDVIASTAFGLKIDSISDEKNEFYQMGKVATNFTAWKNIKFLICGNFKPIAKVLSFTFCF